MDTTLLLYLPNAPELKENTSDQTQVSGSLSIAIPYLLAWLVCPAVLLSTSTGAQAEQLNILEEVVVTARKRTENLQDVPVSINAVSGDKLREAAINKVEDLSSYVPNLTMSETGIGTNIFIRGIGSGINQGFEQSVGMYVDGVYYGRAQLARAPFLDLASIEVLRGPQGVLFGKNSIAGAINMTTARPTDAFEGVASALYEPELDERKLNLVVSGPLTDQLRGRVAMESRAMDGYVKNLTLDRDEPKRDEWTVRTTLDYLISERLDVVLKYERGSFDVKGRQIEILDDHPNLLGPADLGGAGALIAGLSYAEILEFLQGPAFDAGTRNTWLDGKRSSNGDYSNNDTHNMTFTLNYEWGTHTLTAITAAMSYEFDEVCDCDFTGAPVISVRSEEEYEQLSQEIRLLSPPGGKLDYIVGLFYQWSDLDFRDTTTVPQETAIGIIAPYVIGIRVPRDFYQDSRLWAVFGQLNWHITQQLSLAFGARLTDEEKEGGRRLGPYTTLDGGALANPAATITEVEEYFQAEIHSLQDERNDTQLTPSFSIQYHINDAIMTYLSAAQGFKSGGYDARSNTPPGSTVWEGSFEYDEEKALNIELGSKIRFANGRADLNIALFRTEYDDLQVSIFDGTLGFNVGNAGEAITQGMELDGRWLLASNLILSGSLAYLDFEFQKFEQGQCYFGETPTATIGDTQYCDRKGATNQYVADWSGNLGLEHSHALGALLLITTVDLLYSDDYYTTPNLDPSDAVIQDAFVKVNLRIALTNGADWELALLGKNLTDEETVRYAADTPLAVGTLKAAGHYGFPTEPRTISLQGTYRF